MSRPKTTDGRVGAAVRMIHTVRPWPRGYGLGGARRWSDLFEMNDGSAVCARLWARILTELDLARVVLVHREYFSDGEDTKAAELCLRAEKELREPAAAD